MEQVDWGFGRALWEGVLWPNTWDKKTWAKNITPPDPYYMSLIKHNFNYYSSDK
jgi:hypothetical protein